jgi:hypothetical protein
MTAREAARRCSAFGERAAVGSANALLHHWMGRDPEVFRCDCSCSPPPSSVPCVFRGAIYYRVEGGRIDRGF